MLYTWEELEMLEAEMIKDKDLDPLFWINEDGELVSEDYE